jgi:hypothetical protein
MKISEDKSKVMVFQGRPPATSKIILQGRITEQENKFKVLGSAISCA